MTDYIYDPNRTVSTPLTEVRTVLSRARTAIDTVEHSPDLTVKQGRWTYHGADEGSGYVGRETVPHPEHADMLDALRKTVALLARWERLAGKPRAAE